MKDAGTGFPNEVLRRIKGGDSVTTKENGNRLGLSSMVCWAKKQNIQFEIDSLPDQGIEVSLHIPSAGVLP